ncbi:RfbC dTDP-4-dehydrorhamnose 3,5-epimerase and related enzymes [Rhabdaerophilaceae bacterium]
MIFEKTALPGVIRVVPTPHRDERGSFTRLYCPMEFAKAGIGFNSIQVNLSQNPVQFTLRGLHFQQSPRAEAKFIRVVRGAIYEVVVDLRSESPGFRQHIALRIDAEGSEALFIPEGCAHGFLTLEPDTDILYQMGRMHEPGHASGLRWNDPTLGIRWPAEPSLISPADEAWPFLES